MTWQKTDPISVCGKSWGNLKHAKGVSVAEPILRPGNIVMRGNDSRCKDIPAVRDLPWWGKDARGVVEWAYEIRSRGLYGKSMFVIFGDGFGGGRDALDMAVLVLAAIKHTLKTDHLIDTIDGLYGDDPEAVYGLTSQLSVWCQVSKSKAYTAIESYQLSKRLSSHPDKAEIALDGWHEMAMGSLGKEFLERGWIDEPT